MHIGILGTGQVGRTLATGFLAAGHRVTLGSRTRDNAAAHEWAAAHAAAHGDGAAAGDFADAARADLLLLAVPGAAAHAALAAAGPAADGKIVIDLTNPLDFSQGFPPRLTHVNDSSLAESLQAAFPSLRLVKALNTVSSELMVAPGLLPEETDLPICGEDPAAKEAVRALLAESFGWRRFVDLGGIANARGTEAWLLLWTRLYGALGTARFNLRLVGS